MKSVTTFGVALIAAVALAGCSLFTYKSDKTVVQPAERTVVEEHPSTVSETTTVDPNGDTRTVERRKY